ncbi:hypothetical protein ES702_00403 [subsurface metagenome]
MAVSVTAHPTTSEGRQKHPTQGSPLLDLRVNSGGIIPRPVLMGVVPNKRGNRYVLTVQFMQVLCYMTSFYGTRLGILEHSSSYLVLVPRSPRPVSVPDASSEIELGAGFIA